MTTLQNLRSAIEANRRLALMLANAETDGPTSRSLHAASVHLKAALSEIGCAVEAAGEGAQVVNLWDRITGE